MPGILVCSSFLISVCMFIVSKALLISSATVIIRTGGAIWLNPFTMVLFNVCSVVTVECCVLYATLLPGCVWYVFYYVRKIFSSVFTITERGDMGLYEVPLLGFGIGTMLTNFHVWCIMFLLRAVLNILVRNASPRGPMCFRCLIFNLPWPCELLFLLCFIASWTWEGVSVTLYPCMLCVLVRGCGVSRGYIDVCYCDMFSVVNMYIDHLKFCVVCINSRRYVCCVCL